MSVVRKQQDKFKDYISLKQLLFLVKNTFQLGLKCLLMVVPLSGKPSNVGTSLRFFSDSPNFFLLLHSQITQ